jgi:CRP/FNR family transcriptional regulator, cyclic AMP receptor protein
MSETGTRVDADRSHAPFLGSVPLFDGIPEAELAELAQILRRRELSTGDVMWREGTEAEGLVLIVEGRVSLSLTLPGERAVDFDSLGSGEILGEVPLVDGGRHSATATATAPTTVLLLRRTDFASLVSRRHPTAFAIKRRIAGVACGRLRVRLAGLAESLRADAAGELAVARTSLPAELEFCGPPDSGYVRRLATFHAFDSLALWGFLTAGRYARCPAGRTLIAEGSTPDACFLTINGAVEKVIVRGGRRIRVGLAGPGQAFGYESLMDGRPAPTTAATRERTLLLMLPRVAFARLFYEETEGSRVFIDVINRDVVAALRQVLRPQAGLATSW